MEDDFTSKENDSEHKVTGEGDAVLPGETLVTGTDNKKKKRKKKSLRFSSGTEDSEEVNNNGQFANTNDIDNGETNTNNSASVDLDPDYSTSGESRSRYDDSSGNGKASKNSSNNSNSNNSLVSNNAEEEKVLIEIGGKFEWVPVKDLQSMGYPVSESIESSGSSRNSSSSKFKQFVQQCNNS